MLVEATNASFGYRGRAVVRADELRLEAGRCLGVYGPNGSGKTTLVRGLAGLIAPLSGTVASTPGLRVGYVAQHRAGESHWPMTALDAAALATSAGRRFGWVGRHGRTAIAAQLESLGVAGLARRPFAQLSGGQQQRVLLAGAMAADPQVLILDEPTEGLDASSRDALLGRLREAMSAGLCAVLVSHDVRDLLALADAVAVVEPAGSDAAPNPVEPIAPAELASRLLTARRGTRDRGRDQ